MLSLLPHVVDRPGGLVQEIVVPAYGFDKVL